MSDAYLELIRQFVQRNTDGLPIDDDEDIFDTGYANSLFAVQLVMWLERTFGLTVQRSELMRDQLRSVCAIAEFVRSRTAAPEDVAWTSS